MILRAIHFDYIPIYKMLELPLFLVAVTVPVFVSTEKSRVPSLL